MCVHVHRVNETETRVSLTVTKCHKHVVCCEQNNYTHELTAVMAVFTRPAQDEVSQPSSLEKKRLVSPHPDCGAATDGFQERERQF